MNSQLAYNNALHKKGKSFIQSKTWCETLAYPHAVSRGLIYWYRLPLMPALISNHIQCCIISIIYSDIPKHQWCNRWSEGMHKGFHPTFYWVSDTLCMLGLRLVHVSNGGGPMWLHNRFHKYTCFVERCAIVWYINPNFSGLYSRHLANFIIVPASMM